MPSPQSGTVGSPVSPTEPKDANDADDAKGGTSTSYSRSTDEAQNGHKPDPEKKSWIEIELIYESNGKPVPGTAFEVKLPDGSIAGGSTDENGFARVEGFDPGSCEICFNELDKEAWEDA
jgi:hypothetical protein